jgi:hypothetical protein
VIRVTAAFVGARPGGFVRRVPHHDRMATVTAARGDIFPVGTSVAVVPAGAINPGGAPTAPAIASASVDAAGLLTVTDAGISSLTPYGLYASVGGEFRYLRARSTLDKTDAGTATGTVDTTNASTALANVSASVGAFAVGQAITGAGIPPGTTLVSGSAGSWVMSAAATASASTVAVAAYGARVPAANLGSTLIPSRISTTWQAQLRQRRSLAGTS